MLVNLCKDKKHFLIRIIIHLWLQPLSHHPSLDCFQTLFFTLFVLHLGFVNGIIITLLLHLVPKNSFYIRIWLSALISNPFLYLRLFCILHLRGLSTPYNRSLSLSLSLAISNESSKTFPSNRDDKAPLAQTHIACIHHCRNLRFVSLYPTSFNPP